MPLTRLGVINFVMRALSKVICQLSQLIKSDYGTPFTQVEFTVASYFFLIRNYEPIISGLGGGRTNGERRKKKRRER
jgi:hypothetical protein